MEGSLRQPPALPQGLRGLESGLGPPEAPRAPLVPIQDYQGHHPSRLQPSLLGMERLRLRKWSLQSAPLSLRK